MPGGRCSANAPLGDPPALLPSRHDVHVVTPRPPTSCRGHWYQREPSVQRKSWAKFLGGIPSIDSAWEHYVILSTFVRCLLAVSKLQAQHCFSPARNARYVAIHNALCHFTQAMRSIAGGVGERVPPQKIKPKAQRRGRCFGVRRLRKR